MDTSLTKALTELTKVATAAIPAALAEWRLQNLAKIASGPGGNNAKMAARINEALERRL